jgi:hypothetical protein
MLGIARQRRLVLRRREAASKDVAERALTRSLEYPSQRSLTRERLRIKRA